MLPIEIQEKEEKNSVIERGEEDMSNDLILYE